MFSIYKRNYNINCLVHGNTKESLYEYIFKHTKAYYLGSKSNVAFFLENKTLMEINLHAGSVFIYDKGFCVYTQNQESYEKEAQLQKSLSNILHIPIKNVYFKEHLSETVVVVYEKYINVKNAYINV